MRKSLSAGICISVVMLFAAALLMGGTAFAGDDAGQGVIDVNTATVKELSALPGIGKKRAEAIVAYRTLHNKFEDVDELRKVEGIGKKTFAKLRERVVVK